MISTRGKDYLRKWEFPLPKGIYRFISRKDASKFLTQIINKQRNGYNRAGLGMVDPKSKTTATSSTSSHILSGEKNLDKLSISEISALIRQKHEKNKNCE